MTVLRFALFALVLAASTSSSLAGRTRGVFVEGIRNDDPSFLVRVSVDHKDRVYRGGDVMKVTVESERAGYLYLLYRDAQGNSSVLFPNRRQTDNRIPAGQRVEVPGPNSSFRLRVGAPYGEELLKAVVTKRPLKGLDLESLTLQDATPIDPDKAVRAVRVEYDDRPADWAEHHVSITTVAPDAPRQRTRRRIGLFIGISDFAHISDLTICHQDARQMAQAMRQHGKLDEVRVLTDSAATLEAIREAIRWLAEKTEADDEVFIFWSGHGGQCADDDGDEEDGFDEYLVPYDAQISNLATIRRTMLMDDAFGRWLQDLDGRKVAVILDTCFSGGQSSAAKNLVDFDFFTSEFGRAKDVGQQDAALLCSSQANEVSFERRENDLSVMTYFLVEAIGAREKLTLAGAHAAIESPVAAYLRSLGDDLSQTPVLYGAGSDIYLRP